MKKTLIVVKKGLVQYKVKVLKGLLAFAEALAEVKLPLYIPYFVIWGIFNKLGVTDLWLLFLKDFLVYVSNVMSQFILIKLL